MTFPCETAIWKALPAIKSSLAQALVKLEMSQREVAKLLSTTEASISHYVKGKRGSALMIGPPMQEEINRLADRIKTETIPEEDLVKEMCTLCQKVRRSCAICGAESEDECDRCEYL